MKIVTWEVKFVRPNLQKLSPVGMVVVVVVVVVAILVAVVVAAAVVVVVVVVVVVAVVVVVVVWTIPGSNPGGTGFSATVHTGSGSHSASCTRDTASLSQG
jgi:hypothetical protein